MKNNKEFCTHCGTDLQGNPIPKEFQKLYGATHFNRKIGITSIELDMNVSRLQERNGIDNVNYTD